MSRDLEFHGSIRVAPRAIATIAYQATIESYGVVGLASKNLINGLRDLIVKDPTHGIKVHYSDEKISLDIYIIVEYGLNIKSVADNVAEGVRFHVEKALGTPIHAVNVHVQGLRISEEEPAEPS